MHAKTRAGRLRLAARRGDGRDAVRKLAVDVGVRKGAGDPKLYNGVTWEGERVTALSYEVDTRDGREYGVTVRPAGGGRRGAVELQLVDERRHAEAPAWPGRAGVGRDGDAAARRRGGAQGAGDLGEAGVELVRERART